MTITKIHAAREQLRSKQPFCVWLLSPSRDLCHVGVFSGVGMAELWGGTPGMQLWCIAKAPSAVLRRLAQLQAQGWTELCSD